MGQVASHISGLFTSPSKSNKATTEKNKSDNHISNDKYTKQNNQANDISYSFGILATPRNALKRSRQVSPKVSIPQSILDIFAPAKRARVEEEYVDFTFLDDNETINYYKKSKVMIILRGLPGSGKSTIAKHVQKKYLSSKICSADNFFMKDGEYVYDRFLIKDAHAHCQENAIKAAQDQVQIIIIDNTNLKRWEMNFYLDLAKTFNYIPVIAESKTPWRRDVSQLVSKTMHNIDENIMELKNKDFENLLAIYYGWFLNEKDSHFLREEGFRWMEVLSHHAEFKRDFGFESVADLANFYESPAGGILHCTAGFIGKNLSPENKMYIEKCESQVGKAFDMEVIGFVLTPRTFGTRIKLSDKHLIVWSKDDNEDIPQEFWDTVSAEEQNLRSEVQNGVLNGHDDSATIVNETESETQVGNTSDKLSDLSLNNSNAKDASVLFHISNGLDADENSILNSSVASTIAYINTLNKNPEHGSEGEASNLEKSWKAPSPKKNPNQFTGFSSPKKNPNQFTGFSSPKKNPNQFTGFSPHKKSPRKQKSGILIPENTLNIDETVTRRTVIEKISDIPEEEKFIPTRGAGSRAHLTLGCASEVKPVTTGLDLIFTIQKENIYNKSQSISNGEEEINGNANLPVGEFEADIEGAVIRNYGHGVWVVYLENSLVFKSVFSGFY